MRNSTATDSSPKLTRFSVILRSLNEWELRHTRWLNPTPPMPSLN
jgi:hypothetical protein